MVDDLEDNYECTARCLKSQTKRLLKGDSQIMEYNACILQYIEKGHAEPVSEDCSNSKAPVYSMPH